MTNGGFGTTGHYTTENGRKYQPQPSFINNAKPRSENGQVQILRTDGKCRRGVFQKPHQDPCGRDTGEMHLLRTNRERGWFLLEEPTQVSRGQCRSQEVYLLRTDGQRRWVLQQKPEPRACTGRLIQSGCSTIYPTRNSASQFNLLAISNGLI